MHMLEPGTLIQDRYEVVRLIGKGGMGAVYEAIDQRLKSTVALKQTLISDPKLDKAFEREAHLLASLRHSSLTRVTDYFTEQQGQFLVMDFVLGNDLGELLEQRGGAFDLDEVLSWSDKLLDALEYLHTQQIPIIHRDIKPQNLKLTPRGEVILLDFGLAKGAASMQSRVTTGGSIFGYTPRYAPIEQVQGTGTDPRSDLYSLAATIYHLLTNEAPADALTRAAAVLNGQPDPLRPLHVAAPQVPEPVSQVIMQAMALGSDERHFSASAMRHALKNAAAQGSSPQSASPGSGAYTGATIVTRTPQPSQPSQPSQPQAQVSQPGGAPYTPPASLEPAEKPKRNWRSFCLGPAIGFIIAALLLCVLPVVVLTYIGAEAREEEEEATATALALQPTDAPLDGREPTDGPPPLFGADEDEATPAPVITLEPDTGTGTGAGLEVPDSWDYVVQDSFDNNLNDWPVGDDDDEWSTGGTYVENGVYRVEAQAHQDFVWVNTPTMSPLTDFVVRVQAQRITGDEETSEYGLAFRYTGGNASSYYTFRVTDDQYFRVSMTDGGEWTTLIEWTSSDLIEPGGINELAVSAEGSTFQLFINGVQVESFEDDTLPEGKAGVLVAMNEDEYAAYEFDDFSIQANE